MFKKLWDQITHKRSSFKNKLPNKKKSNVYEGYFSPHKIRKLEVSAAKENAWKR